MTKSKKSKQVTEGSGKMTRRQDQQESECSAHHKRDHLAVTLKA